MSAVSLSPGTPPIEDKLQALKYIISGQGISLIVLKATTNVKLAPKKKHLDYLTQITNEPNVSIPNLVKYIKRRARQPDWMAAFKSLITIHHLMGNANERFIQNLASSNENEHTFTYLANFCDRSSRCSLDMSTFVRRYSRYIVARIVAYRSRGTDFCRIKINGRHPLVTKVSNCSIEQLIVLLNSLENQVVALLGFDASIIDINNGIISAAFALLYKDLVKLYILYQSAIIRLLACFFSSNQTKQLKQLAQSYRKFYVIMNKVNDFMRAVNTLGLNRGEMPEMSRTPELQPISLEEHLKSLETRGRGGTAKPVQEEARQLSRLDYNFSSLTRGKNSRTQRSPEFSRAARELTAALAGNTVNRLGDLSATNTYTSYYNCDTGSLLDEAMEAKEIAGDELFASSAFSGKIGQSSSKSAANGPQSPGDSRLDTTYEDVDLMILSDSPPDGPPAGELVTSPVRQPGDWVQLELP